MTTAARPDWHAQRREAVLERLDVGGEGLTSDEVHERLARHGPNELPAARSPSLLALAVGELTSPLMYALVAAGVLAIVLGELEDGLVVLAVVALNTVIGTVQEYRAGQAIAALGELVAEPARVRRDGRWLEVPAADVVPGDVVGFVEGQRVPADVRVLRSSALRTQESALTGESAPVDKRDITVASDAPLAERAGVAYAGTTVAAGSGEGVAVATGLDTELGRIAQLLGEQHPLETPLTRQLDRIGRVITLGIAVAAVALSAVAAIRGFPVGEAALAGISLAVAAVPEGLPAVVTIALAIGVQRMARRRAIVRRLPAVETLGSTTVVASDKTGTLTRNQMTVQALWTPAHQVATTEDGPLGALPADVRELLRAGVLCNDAKTTAGGEHLGDPTETALLAVAERAGVAPRDERAAAPRLAAIPFDPERRLMATVHSRPGGATILYVKGAPETLLPRCADGRAETARHKVEALAERGERVLLFARRHGVEPSPDAIEAALDHLELIGLQAMIDPPRDEAREAIAACHAAGIRVLMITGDHPATARSIGHSLGLEDRVALTGPELDRLDDARLRMAVQGTDIYARVEPEHKLRLIQALRADHGVVAMTGDGVNDAPALHQADIGIAMGQSGTATARDAADMVLADDNFATIRAAIEEGRRVYDNLVKALTFVLPTSVGQALIIAVAVLAVPFSAGEPILPISPVQILWINLIVAVALALPLALEAPEPGSMDRPPRDPSASLLDRPLLVRTLAVSAMLTAVALGLFELEHSRQLDAGVSEQLATARAQTTAVTGAVLFQAIYLLSCRSLVRSNREIGLFSNPSVYAGIAIVLALQAAFVLLPAMHTIFGSATIDPTAIAYAAVGSLLVLPVTAAEEQWRKRRR